MLNDHFASMNICFNLIGMDTINSTAHHTGSSLGVIKSYAQANGKVREDAFNIYSPHSLSRGSGQSGYNQTNVAIISGVIGNSNSRTLYHEIGHCFNLIHTFGNSNERPDPINCEHVTRDPNEPSYNAATRGDLIVDTNAVPNFQREQTNHFAYAVYQAGLVNSWGSGRALSLRESGFNDLPNAAAIAQALAEYGFTLSEINHLRYNPAMMDAYYDIENCTYLPDSRVNLPASPFFKNCEGTPYQVTQADIKNIMAYSTSGCGYLFTTGQAIRVHEAIQNDTIFDSVMSLKNIDLYVRDTESDIGQEPNIHTNVFWNSQDIWVRNQNDGMVNQEHQNPVYDQGNPNYVYIKVRNKGCGTSSGNDKLKLYWAKANTALDWDSYWTGQVFVGNVPMGGELATVSIPSIGSGEDDIIEIEWPIPNPQDYVGINPNPWHFCLLARIESIDDPMAFPEGTFITDNVKSNNNIGWKNTTIIEIAPNTFSVGAVIGVSNPSSTIKSYSLELVSDDMEPGKAIYQEAEIGVEMDSILYEAWKRGNKSGQNYSPTAKEKKIIATGNNVLIDDIMFLPNEYGTAYISFNILTKEMTGKQSYTYQVIQRDKATNKIMGGETFEIRKQPRGAFYADAGHNREIDRNDSIVLQATDINETAVYNWYDSDGQLIHTGTDLTVSPEITEQYKLEIISNLDGLKDYADVVVTVNPYRIISMAPNPTSSDVNIAYKAEGVTSAYIMILNQSTAVSDNYILDPDFNEITIDMTNHQYGLYTVILVCDGEIHDSKNLAKQ